MDNVEQGENVEGTPVEGGAVEADNSSRDFEALLKENETLKAQLAETRSEAAKRRVKTREVSEENKSLEERLAALEAENKQNRLEAARSRFVASKKLPYEFGELLGDDPDMFEERYKTVDAYIQARVGEKSEEPVVDEGSLKPVNSVKGGLEPLKQEDNFDPIQIVRSSRKR